MTNLVHVFEAHLFQDGIDLGETTCIVELHTDPELLQPVVDEHRYPKMAIDWNSTGVFTLHLPEEST